MKKSIWVVGIIAILILIVIGIYLYKPKPIPTPSEITYDDCVEEILSKLRTLPSAKDEPIGTKRTDEEGRVWIKSDEIGTWDFEGNPIPGAYAWKSDSSPGSLLDNEAIDEFLGGINYVPEDLDVSKCEKYIFTRNAKMEEGIGGIVNEVIEEQKQKGVIISIEELEVLNLVGRSQAFIKLNCNEDMVYETEEEIVKNIAEALFQKYPNEYAKDSSRDSWVDVHCVYYDMGWSISDGYYGINF